MPLYQIIVKKCGKRFWVQIEGPHAEHVLQLDLVLGAGEVGEAAVAGAVGEELAAVLPGAAVGTPG